MLTLAARIITTVVWRVQQNPQFWYKYQFIVVHGKISPAVLLTEALIHSMSFHTLLKVLLICRLPLHLEEHFTYPKYSGHPHNRVGPRLGTRMVLIHVKRMWLHWSVVYLEVTYHTFKKRWSAAVNLLADWSGCGCKRSSQQATSKLHQKFALIRYKLLRSPNEERRDGRSMKHACKRWELQHMEGKDRTSMKE